MVFESECVLFYESIYTTQVPGGNFFMDPTVSLISNIDHSVNLNDDHNLKISQR